VAKGCSPLYVIYHKNIKNERCFIEKNEDRGKYFGREASGAGGFAIERSVEATEAP
jgi:hypothetical protein